MPEQLQAIVDLNCDLGEGETTSTTKALLRYATSANVACGGHAGSPAQMYQTVKLATSAHVKIGAHPGWPDRNSFGRAPIKPTADEVSSLVLQQVAALTRITHQCETSLHHVKLHGALYHSCENDPRLARAFVETICEWFPQLHIYARPEGRVLKVANNLGVKTLAEGFLDRAYNDDGDLVPRNQDASSVLNPTEVRTRIRRWLATKEIMSYRNVPLKLRIQTFCIHSDSQDAIRIARIARKLLPLSNSDN